MKWKWIIAVILILGIILRDKIIVMAEAIKEFEGWKPGSISYRNNNPGNLKYRNQAGAIGEDSQGHAIFDSYESGWSALLNQLTIAIDGHSDVYSPSDTLYEFFGKYAEANTEAYAEFVARRLGVSPETQIRVLG